MVSLPNPTREASIPWVMTPAACTIGMFSEKTAADAEIVDELYATTGAVLIGKRMFDVGVEPWG
jgi:hypothetical protein